VADRERRLRVESGRSRLSAKGGNRTIIMRGPNFCLGSRAADLEVYKAESCPPNGRAGTAGQYG
jgi:hypothetical protein